MNCPYCGKPMEAGHIPGKGWDICVPWIPEKMKRSFVLPTSSKLLNNGGLILRDKSFPAMPYKEVFVCRRCKKGVFSFQTELGDVDDA